MTLLHQDSIRRCIDRHCRCAVGGMDHSFALFGNWVWEEALLLEVKLHGLEVASPLGVAQVCRAWDHATSGSSLH